MTVVDPVGWTRFGVWFIAGQSMHKIWPGSPECPVVYLEHNDEMMTNEDGDATPSTRSFSYNTLEYLREFFEYLDSE